MGTTMNIAREVAALKRMTVKELRSRYAEVFGEATRSGNKDWLWKRIAWRMQAKARAIRDGLDLMAFDPEWSLPSKLEDNPLVWMLEVNGMVVDIRMAPREAQVVAHEQGLIPYIPADRDDS